jgi:hypothetical protein
VSGAPCTNAHLGVFLGTLLAASVTPLAHADTPGLFKGKSLDTSFCQTRVPRSTVVYLDDTDMFDGRTEWVSNLIRKLKASLAPGERTTLIRLIPTTGTSEEIWTGCWPDYTTAQRAEIKKGEPYILQRNPLDGLVDQQGFFARDLNAAISKVYFATKRPVPAAVGARDAPKKQILRALASDENRYSSSTITIRAILYSDMAENSDLGSVYAPVAADTAANYGKKLGTHLRRSIFYVFGVGESPVSDPASRENAKAFWLGALQSMMAVVGGFGSELSVPNGIPIDNGFYDISFKMNDQELDGKLSLLVDADGNLVDSWLVVNLLNITGLTGSFHCSPNNQCKLNAATSSSLTTNRPSEAVSLIGTRESVSGTLGVPGTKALFALQATRSR